MAISLHKCPVCNGTGYFGANICHVCHGTCVLWLNEPEYLPPAEILLQSQAPGRN